MADEFNTGVGGVTKAEAKVKILSMAREQGIEGAFKVFYQGNLVANPNDLPETVQMGQVRVSEVLDQAHDHWFMLNGNIQVLSECV